MACPLILGAFGDEREGLSGQFYVREEAPHTFGPGCSQRFDLLRLPRSEFQAYQAGHHSVAGSFQDSGTSPGSGSGSGEVETVRLSGSRSGDDG